MSETANFVRVGEPICTCNDPKYSGCMKHFPPPPAKAYVVESPSPIAGKADEMPEWMAVKIRRLRAVVRKYGESDCSEDDMIVWLADALDRAQRERDEAINRAVIAGYLYAVERFCAMGEEMANDGYERSYAIAEGYANHYVAVRASLPLPEGK